MECMIGSYVVVRGRDSGVHCGYLIECSGQNVLLEKCSQIWNWYGAETCEEIAEHGLDMDRSSVSKPVSQNLIHDAIETMVCSEESRKILEEPQWNASSS